MNRFLAVLLIPLAAGCADRPAPEGGAPGGVPGVTMRQTEGGDHPEVIVSGDPAPGVLDSVVVMRGQFRGVRSILLDPAGGVWVLDREAKRVVHFSDDGTVGASIGSIGKGDGQFTDPYSLAWGAGDLMVYDPGNSRVGRFHPGGAWVGSWPVVPITGGPNARFFASGTSASAWLFQFSFLSNGEAAPGFARFPLTPRGDVRWVPPTRSGPLPNIVLCTAGDSQSSFSTPYTAGELWQPSPDGQLYHVEGVDYLVSTVDSAGTVLRSFRRDVAGVPITDAEWAEGLAPLERFRTAHPGSCNGAFTRPATKSAIRVLTLDDRSRLWVERMTDSGPVWEVWEGDRLIGAVPGIDRIAAVQVDIRGDRFAVLAMGDNGAPEVRVYRYHLTAPIAPSPAGR